MERDDLLTFRIPAELKLALKEAAAKDERSMSMMAVRILREWLTEKGFYQAESQVTQPRRNRR